MEKDPHIISLKKNETEKSAIVIQKAPRALPGSILVALAIVALALGAGWYIYGSVLLDALRAPASLSISGLATSTQHRGSSVTLSEAELMQRISLLIQLPQGEEPTIAAVADLEPLKTQSFFRNARVGDIVLMYKKSLRAILYDPELNKIIEVAPITVENH